MSVSRRFAQPRQPTTSLTAIFAARGGASSPFNGNNVPTVLVTGGTGYTRSHTCLEVLRTGRYRVGVMDNLKNSSEESLDRVRELLRSEEEDSDKTEMELSDAAAGGGLHFRNCDVHHGLGEEFPSVSGCVHSAGLNAMGELVTEPLDYYGVNASGTACLLKELESAGVPRFVLSSSTTMYGTPEGLPLQEDARLTATNSYGRTKLFVKEMLRDLHASRTKDWNILILRYFNPIGAHPSGRIGEDPHVRLGASGTSHPRCPDPLRPTSGKPRRRIRGRDPRRERVRGGP